jgi:hypothetical protein
MLSNHNLDTDSPLACLLVGQPTLRRTMKLAVLGYGGPAPAAARASARAVVGSPCCLDMPVFGPYGRHVLTTEINRDSFKSFCPVMESAWGACPRSTPPLDGSRR